MADELRSGRGDIDAATRLRAALAAVQARIVEAEVAAMRPVYEAALHQGRMMRAYHGTEKNDPEYSDRFMAAHHANQAFEDVLAAALAGEGESGENTAPVDR